MTTGEKIRAARKAANLTQRQLGDLCGIAEPTIRKYELGKLNPKKETLEKIAQPLNVYYLDLYGDEDAKDIHAYIKKGIKMGSEMKISIQRSEVLAKYTAMGYSFEPDEARLVSAYNVLNDVAQFHVLTLVEAIAKNPRFSLEPYGAEDIDMIPKEDLSRYTSKQAQEQPETALQSTPAPQEGTDTTPSPDAPETPPEGKRGTKFDPP